MMRELARTDSMPAGHHTFRWDGLDRDGNPAPVGMYEWRVLQTPGFRSEYLMSVGTSVGECWWPGNHDGPAVLAAAGDSFIVGAMPEGPPLLTRCGFNGAVRWQRPPSAAAAKTEPIFHPQIYGYPRPVPVTEGRVRILSFLHNFLGIIMKDD